MGRAEAIRAYARQVKNKSLEIDAAEIRIRAERRLGELLALTPKAMGAKGVGNPKNALVKREHTPTLREMNVSMDLSARSQKLAAVPAEIFEEKVATWRERVQEENECVTANLLKITKNKNTARNLAKIFRVAPTERYPLRRAGTGLRPPGTCSGVLRFLVRPHGLALLLTAFVRRMPRRCAGLPQDEPEGSR